MNLHIPPFVLIPSLALLAGHCWFPISANADSAPVFTSPADAEDFKVQGEYAGTLSVPDGELPFGAQVIADGGGKFTFVGYEGGLPEAANADSGRHTVAGQREGDTVRFTSDLGSAEWRDNKIVIRTLDGGTLGELNRVERTSPTLGLPAPPHAIVLFDGSNADAFEGGTLTDDGYLQQGVTSHETFQDARLHLEFRTPFMPAARGQGRGNSGVYLQGRYEVQILDSFGLEGKDNECGGIYGVKAPRVNKALPPYTWQTYDIDYRAPRFDESGKKISDARLTVRHNGVLIHKNVPVPGPTRGATLAEGPEPGPLNLQDHGNPVQFRNIWIVKSAPDQAAGQ